MDRGRLDESHNYFENRSKKLELSLYFPRFDSQIRLFSDSQVKLSNLNDESFFPRFRNFNCEE